MYRTLSRFLVLMLPAVIAQPHTIPGPPGSERFRNLLTQGRATRRSEIWRRLFPYLSSSPPPIEPMRASASQLCIVAFLCVLATPSAEAAFSFRQTLDALPTGAGAADRAFGDQVAVDGDLAVVADRAEATPFVRPKSVVRTYVRSGATWVRQAQVLAFTTMPGGVSVKLSMAGGTLAVMHPNAAGTNTNLHFFRRQNDLWVEDLSAIPNIRCESIAADGLIVACGDPNPSTSNPNFNSGSIRVYRRDQAGAWASVQLTAAIGTNQDNQRFGHSVAIVAGAIVVGAPARDVRHTGNNQVFADAGAAYVFELTGNTWNQQALLVVPDADLATDLGFGHAVAISGADPSTPDRLLVASRRNRNAPGSHVRTYTRTASVWTPRLLLSSNTDDCYGCAVSLDGDWAVIGRQNNATVENFAGMVQVIRFNSSFTSVQSSANRTDPAGERNDLMGSAVAIDRSGPTVLVGAPGAAVHGERKEGVVLIGRGTAGDGLPAPVRTLDLGQGMTDAAFGSSLASDGDTLAVGALAESIAFQRFRGAVHIFQRTGPLDVYGEPVRIVAPDGAPADIFGQALALRGDSLLIGAPNRSVAGIREAGMVYAYRRTAGVWTLEAQLIAPSLVINQGFGQGLAFDGTTAIICGRFQPTTWVFERNANGSWTQTQTLDRRCNGPQLAGDLLLLNDHSSDVPVADIGEVATYLRVNGSWVRQPGSLFGNAEDSRFGADITLDGDLLAVTSFAVPSPVQVFRRTAGNWLPEASLLPNDFNAQTACWSVAAYQGRLAIGCSNQPGPSGPGAAYLFERPAGVWAQTQKLQRTDSASLTATDLYGDQVHFRADGSLFVTIPAHNNEFIGRGEVYFYTEPSPTLFNNGFESD